MIIQEGSSPNFMHPYQNCNEAKIKAHIYYFHIYYRIHDAIFMEVDRTFLVF